MKEKESYDEIVKVLKTEVNDHTTWVDEILSLAEKSQSQNTKDYLYEVNRKMKEFICDSTQTIPRADSHAARHRSSDQFDAAIKPNLFRLFL